jgi:hypothetical protein
MFEPGGPCPASVWGRPGPLGRVGSRFGSSHCGAGEPGSGDRFCPVLPERARAAPVEHGRAARASLAPPVPLQPRLHPDVARFGSTEPLLPLGGSPYACSQGFRPRASLACEHMFSRGTSRLTQHALAAAGLIRSFLLLEDDLGVDWEVDGQEDSGEGHAAAAALHGRKLTRPVRARRPGAPAARAHVCLSPIGGHGGHDQVRPRRTQQAAHRGRPSCGRPTPR